MNEGGNIELYPVYSAEPGSENRTYWLATPAGHVKLLTVNSAASSQFEVGKDYYVDFTPAE